MDYTIKSSLIYASKANKKKKSKLNDSANENVTYLCFIFISTVSQELI